MIVLSGAQVVLPDRLLSSGSLILEADRIAAIEPGTIDSPAGATCVDASGCTIEPGFIDAHVHGVEGHDVLDSGDAVHEVAARLPRYGVTSFCPTSIACEPVILRRFLAAVGERPTLVERPRARVLPAHLESNFINPEYRGAQPLRCLRTGTPSTSLRAGREQASEASQSFTGDDILEVIDAHRSAVGIVTLAPELPGGIDLVRRFVAAGHLVSIGHTAATYDETLAAIEAGATHATHLFNRMPPLSHRQPGAAGAVLHSNRVTAELICDGCHVHPAMIRMALLTKGLDRILAITDGTAGSGLPVGSRTQLGGQSIVVTERTAVLADGTIAGSVLTMDAAFRMLVGSAGASLVDAARVCATAPAKQLGLSETGRIEVGALADVVVLDRGLRVRDTYLVGRSWRNPAQWENV